VVEGVYELPGVPDRLVILSVTGRAYGCERTEWPVMLSPHRRAEPELLKQ